MRQALNSSQLIAVMEVHNQTSNTMSDDDARLAGERLRDAIHEVLDPKPARLELRQSALSQSWVPLDQAAPPPRGARRLAAAALAAAPGAALAPSPSGSPNNSGFAKSALVVLNMTFANADEAEKVRRVLQCTERALVTCLPVHGCDVKSESGIPWGFAPLQALPLAVSFPQDNKKLGAYAGVYLCKP